MNISGLGAAAALSLMHIPALQAATLYTFAPEDYAIAPVSASGSGATPLQPRGLTINVGFSAEEEAEFGIPGLASFFDTDNLTLELTNEIGDMVAFPSRLSFVQPVQADWFAFAVTDRVAFPSVPTAQTIEVTVNGTSGQSLGPDLPLGSSDQLQEYDALTATEAANQPFVDARNACLATSDLFNERFCALYAETQTGALTGNVADDVLACFDDPAGFAAPGNGGGFGFGGGGGGFTGSACVRSLTTGSALGGGTSTSAGDQDDPDQTDQCINIGCVIAGGFVKPGMEISEIELSLLGRGPDDGAFGVQPLRYIFIAGNLTDEGAAFFAETLSPAPVPLPAAGWLLIAALGGLWLGRKS